MSLKRWFFIHAFFLSKEETQDGEFDQSESRVVS